MLHMEYNPFLATWVEGPPRLAPQLPVALQLHGQTYALHNIPRPMTHPCFNLNLAHLQLTPRSSLKPSQTPGHKWTCSHWPLSTHSASTQAPSSKYRQGQAAWSKAQIWTSWRHLLGSTLPRPKRIPEDSLHVLRGQQHLPEPPLLLKPPSTQRGRSQLPKDRFRLLKSTSAFHQQHQCSQSHNHGPRPSAAGPQSTTGHAV